MECYSYGKYGHYAGECRDKECDEEANLLFTNDEVPTLMLAEKMPNLLMLTEEEVMANPSINGEDKWRPACGT